jgi:hypothetical protein
MFGRFCSFVQLRMFPELRLLASQTERDAVLRGTWHIYLRCPATWIAAILFVPVVLAIGAFIHYLHSLTSSLVLDIAISFLVFTYLTIGMGMSVCVLLVVRPSIRRHIREELQKRGIPICIGCGYDLRGQDTFVCPECGMTFDPGLLLSIDLRSMSKPEQNGNPEDLMDGT